MTTVELRFNEAEEIVCDWGTFKSTPTMTVHYDRVPPRITLDDVLPLILISGHFVIQHHDADPDFDRIATFYADDGRRFMRIDAINGTWTWELFPARWWDGAHRIADEIWVGRWPD